MRQFAKVTIYTELSPLYMCDTALTSTRRQKIINVAHILDQIWTALMCGIITRIPNRPSTSKPFCTTEISVIARDRMWKQAKHHFNGSIAFTVYIQKKSQLN